MTSYFCIPVPDDEKDIFFVVVLVLEGLIDLNKIIQLQVFGIAGWGIDLDYHDIEWFALEMNRDHSVIFQIESKYCISDSFLTVMATPFLLRDSCPQ